MRFRYKYITFIILLILFTISTNSFAQSKINFLNKDIKRKMQKIPRITPQKALLLFKANKILIIDTHEHMKKGQKSPIVVAVSIPYPMIPKIKLKIPKDKIIACF